MDENMHSDGSPVVGQIIHKQYVVEISWDHDQFSPASEHQQKQF